jgi:hypothetical protein
MIRDERRAVPAAAEATWILILPIQLVFTRLATRIRDVVD